MQKILSKNLNDIKNDYKHQQITICCSNGVLCYGDGKMFELDNNGINNIDNLDQHGPVFTYINTNNHDSIKRIEYTGEIGNDNQNEKAKLLNGLKTELNEHKIAFEKTLLDKIISILKNVFDGIDNRKGINIPQYLKKKEYLKNLWLAIIDNDPPVIGNEAFVYEPDRPRIILYLNNIYSFISEFDKMFAFNSVFTEDVSELKLYNRPFIIKDQTNNEDYRGKANRIKDLKTKILKKMKLLNRILLSSNKILY